MKLYMVPLAPNPTKVMLYIAEREALGTQMNIEQIVVNTVKGRHKEPAHLARNPFGTVPTLELDDGSFLVESLAIIHYPGRQIPGKPTAIRHTRTARPRPRRRAHCGFAPGRPHGRLRSRSQLPLGYPKDDAKAAQMEAAMQAPLDYLERLLSDGRPLLLGDRVSIVDCTLQASLQFMRYVEADVFGDRPLLRDWDKRYRARPAAQAVLRW